MHRRISTWRDSAPVRAVDEALAAYDAGAPFDQIPVLGALMTERGARNHVDPLMTVLARTLGAQPLGHVALRHIHDGRRSSLILSRAGRVTLSLETRIGSPTPDLPARTCVLTDVESHDLVLGGAMDGRLIRAVEGEETASFAIMPLSLRTGDTSVRHGRREVVALDRIAGCFTRLRLQRLAEVPAPARAYDLVTGARVGQASPDVAISRRALMVALLGRMDRAGDAPVLADIARDAADTDLRWEAVRECLGLDTATGFRLLGELARRVGDPIQADAAALRARLLAQHPQLAALEDGSPCPA